MEAWGASSANFLRCPWRTVASFLHAHSPADASSVLRQDGKSRRRPRLCSAMDVRRLHIPHGTFYIERANPSRKHHLPLRPICRFHLAGMRKYTRTIAKSPPRSNWGVFPIRETTDRLIYRTGDKICASITRRLKTALHKRNKRRHLAR